jgi:uncharacterized integral membrane protein
MEEKVDETKKIEAYQAGVFVLVILVVLTLGEFAFSYIAVTWWQPLILIAVLKAVYVLKDYMHIGRLFVAEEEDHS